MPKVVWQVRVEQELLDAARNCAAHLAGPPERMNLTKLVNRALAKEITRLTRKYNKGRPFPSSVPK